MNRPAKQPIPGSQQGSALLVSLGFTLVLALALASYQAVCYYTFSTSMRAMQSVRARQLAEAGLEEALWSLNNSNVSGSNGWTLSNGNATKSLSGFTYESAAVTGQVAITITGYAANKPSIAAAAVVTGADGTAISRTLTASTGASTTATTGKAPLFANAMAAVGTYSASSNPNGGLVSLTSSGITVDSYNSSLGNYPGSSSTNYSAVLSGNNSVNLASGTQVKGYVATPPTSSNNVSLTNSGTAKLTGPSTSGSIKIDTTRQTTSPYQPIFDVPSTSGTTLHYTGGNQSLGTAGATTPTIYTASVNDTSGWAGWYNLAAGTLTINGPVIIVIPGNLYINGSGSIVISSTSANASLQIIISGSAYIYQNGINNQTKLAANLSIIGYGASSYSGNLVQFYTSTPYYGTVYAPDDDITVYGYSSTTAMYGSLVGNSVIAYPNGVASLPIHYDTNLSNAVLTGVTTPFAVSSITDSSL